MSLSWLIRKQTSVDRAKNLYGMPAFKEPRHPSDVPRATVESVANELRPILERGPKNARLLSELTGHGVRTIGKSLKHLGCVMSQDHGVHFWRLP